MKKHKKIVCRSLGIVAVFVSLCLLNYVVEKRNVLQAPGCLIAVAVAMLLSLETTVEFLQARNDVEEPILLHIVGGAFIALIDICALTYTVVVTCQYTANVGTFIAVLAMVFSLILGLMLLWAPRFVIEFTNDGNND